MFAGLRHARGSSGRVAYASREMSVQRPLDVHALRASHRQQHGRRSDRRDECASGTACPVALTRVKQTLAGLVTVNMMEADE